MPFSLRCSQREPEKSDMTYELMTDDANLSNGQFNVATGNVG